MASANVLPIIDTSASMTYSGYVDVTKTDSSAFVRSARPGDRIGVASYDTYGRITYPPGGSALVTVDFSLQQTLEAAAAINALSFMGNSTNIGDGIVQARKLMDPAPMPKGLVLLSDGYQNSGTNPLNVLPAYPIYSCAMGPYSDQNLMYQIALRTGGQYYFAPNVLDMTLIFNQIRGEQPLTAVVTNEQAELDNASHTFDVPIAGGQDGAQFMVVWNPADAPPPSVQLLQPDGSPWTTPPDVQDAGFAAWNLMQPASVGTWRLVVAATGPKLTVTGAGFEFGADADNLTLAVTRVPVGGSQYRLEVELAQDGVALDGVRVSAHVVRPQMGLREAVDRYRQAIAELEIAEGETPGDLPPEVARLQVLERRRGTCLLPVVREQVSFQGCAGLVAGTRDDSATVRVVASGTTAGGATAQRTYLFTIALFA